MTYHNQGKGKNSDYIRPNFGSGSIFAPNTGNANNQSGKTSVILRNMNAGPYGSMNALVQTTILGDENPNEFLNSGLIFRSNGDEHLILNIYGFNKSGSNSGKLAFRVCKVVGQEINNKSKGDCKMVVKEATSSDLSITSNDFIKLASTIDTKDYLTVSASVGDNTWKGGVSVKDLGFNDITHTYVGISLADQSFKIYDNGWASASFDDECWDIPTIWCSFTDKYVGETVPIDEAVTPVVLVSSWFDENNCTTQFHYNGCDNETSEKIKCDDLGGEGEPGEIGSKVTGDYYTFTREGIHGYSIGENKKAQEASVKAVCPGNVSLDALNSSYSCGTFWVGNVQSCSEDMEFTGKNDSKYLNENEPIEIPIENSEGFLNMRGSVLHVDVETSQDEFDANIKIQLQSTNGMNSLTRTINTKGSHEIGVNIIANTIGFDPQQVSKIIVTSDKSIYLDKLYIRNTCGNKLEFDCTKLKAEFNPQNNSWKVHAPPKGNNVTCTYTADDANIEPAENIIKCGDQSLTYKPNTSFNFWSNDLPTFTVTARDKNNVTATCSVTGENVGNFNPTCSIPKDKQSIPLGEEAPPFKFKIGNAGPGPGGMGGWGKMAVNYTVYLDNDPIKQNGTAPYGEEQTVTSKATLGSGSHQYKVETQFGYMTQTCIAEFTVEDATKKQPEINCAESSVDNNGLFTVVINNPDDINYNYTFSVTDHQGHVLHGANGSGTATTLSYEYNTGLAGKYLFNIVLSGEDRPGKTCSKEIEVMSPISISCPDPILDQDPGTAISVDASVENCEGCAYKIYYGDNLKNENNELFFYDNNAKGTRQYRLEATDNKGNKASCPFSVSFADVSNNDATELTYDGDWVTFSEGSHMVTCSGNQYSGSLVCKCVNAEYGYTNCNIEYNGRHVSIQSLQTNGNSVDGSNDKCYNGFTVRIVVLPPEPVNTSNQSKAKLQSSGIQCRHAW